MLDLEQLGAERIRPIRRAEYDRMVEVGLFEGEKVELLRGLLVEVSPQGAGHAHAVRELTKLFVLALGDRADVSAQLPFAALADSEPEPDLALVRPGPYLEDHPTEALLVLEVSASSLAKDRTIKAGIYAESGVPEYWIVNLVDRVVEVHKDPAGGAYGHVETVRPGAVLSPAAFPDVTIPVDRILPRA